jgi:hypothetical protein
MNVVHDTFSKVTISIINLSTVFGLTLRMWLGDLQHDLQRGQAEHECLYRNRASANNVVALIRLPTIPRNACEHHTYMESHFIATTSCIHPD